MLPWPASSWARFAASVSRHHRIPRTSRRLDFVVRAKLRVRQSASKATAATKQKPATAVQLPGATQPLQTARTQQPVKRHKQAERQAVVESEKTMLVKYELSPGLCLAYRSAGMSATCAFGRTSASERNHSMKTASMAFHTQPLLWHSRCQYSTKETHDHQLLLLPLLQVWCCLTMMVMQTASECCWCISKLKEQRVAGQS